MVLAFVVAVAALVLAFYFLFRNRYRSDMPARVSDLIIFPIKSCAGLVR